MKNNLLRYLFAFFVLYVLTQAIALAVSQLTAMIIPDDNIKKVVAAIGFLLWFIILFFIIKKVFTDMFIRIFNKERLSLEEFEFNNKKILLQFSLIFFIISIPFLLFVCGTNFYVDKGAADSIFLLIYPMEVALFSLFFNFDLPFAVLFIIQFALHLPPFAVSLISVNSAYTEASGYYIHQLKREKETLNNK